MKLGAGIQPRPLWRSLAIFALSFFALQFGWSQARGTRLERWVIDGATVQTSVALVNVLTPQVAATARGPNVWAAGGGINVRNGCEGTEVLFLLLAGLLAHPFSWRARVLGLLGGSALIFLANQARLLALFYSVRNDPALFAYLHGLVTPLLLVACTLGFFIALLGWDLRQAAHD